MMESILGMLIGAGLCVGGLHLHNSDYHDGRQILVDANGRESLADPPSNMREHMGYLMGAAGGVIFVLSAKRAWDQHKKRRAAVSLHLDQTFQQLRVQLHRGRATRMASNLRIGPLPKAMGTPLFASRSARGYLDRAVHNSIRIGSEKISDGLTLNAHAASRHLLVARPLQARPKWSVQ